MCIMCIHVLYYIHIYIYIIYIHNVCYTVHVKKSFRIVGLVLYCCATLIHALLMHYSAQYCTVRCGYCTVSTRAVNVMRMCKHEHV